MITWNLAGLINKLSDQDLVDYLHTFDILTLTETHMEHAFDHTIKFQEYDCRQVPATKLHGLGHASGGIIMLTRKTLSTHITLHETNGESIIKCSINKEAWGTDKDVVIIGAYVHPIDSKYYNTKEYNSTLEHIEDILLTEVEAGVEAHYVITEDLNSRLGTWGYEQIDDTGEEGPRGEGKTYCRDTDDEHINTFGKLTIEMCIGFGLVPLNGLRERKFDGSHTFMSTRGNSLIDWFLCSEEIVSLFKRLKIHTRVESDHFPVIADLGPINRTKPRWTPRTYTDKLFWDSNKADDFKKFFETEETGARLQDITAGVSDHPEDSLGQFNELLKEAGSHMAKTVGAGGRPRKNDCKWYDKECRESKKDTQTTLHKLRIAIKYDNRDREELSNEYSEKKRAYKTLINQKKKEYREAIFNEVRNNSGDSKRFWTAVKGLTRSSQTTNSIDNEQWLRHFKSVLDPEGLAQTDDPTQNTGNG